METNLYHDPCKAICKYNKKGCRRSCCPPYCPQKNKNSVPERGRYSVEEHQHISDKQRQVKVATRSIKRNSVENMDNSVYLRQKERRLSVGEEIILIPERYIERLCGKKGRRIETIRRQCCAAIRIFGEGKILVKGTAEAIQEAKEVLYNSLLEAGVDYKLLKPYEVNESKTRIKREYRNIFENSGFDAKLIGRRPILRDPLDIETDMQEGANLYDSYQDIGRHTFNTDINLYNDFVRVSEDLVNTRNELELQTKYVRELGEELNEQPKHYKTLNQDIEYMKKDIIEKEKEIKIQKEICNAVQNNLALETLRLLKAEQKSKEQIDELSISREKYLALEGEVEKLIIDKDIYKDQLDERIKNEQININFEQQNKILENNIDDLKSQNKTLIADYDVLKQNLDENKKYFESIISSKTNRINEKEYELKTKIIHIEVLEKKHASCRDDNSTKLKDTEEAIRKQKEVNKSLKSELFGIKEDLENQYKDMNELREELKQKASMVTDKSEKIQKLESEIHAQKDKWRSKLALETLQLSKAEEMIEEQNKNLKELENKCLMNQDELENLKIEKNKYKTKLDERIIYESNEIKTLIEKERKKSSDLERAKQVMKELNFQILTLKDKEENCKKKFIELTKEIEFLKGQLQDNKSNMEGTLLLKYKNLEEKESELLTKTKLNNILEQSIEKLKEEYQTKITEKDEIISKEKEIIGSLEKENKDLKRYKIQMTEEMIMNQKNLAKSFQDIKALERTVKR